MTTYDLISSYTFVGDAIAFITCVVLLLIIRGSLFFSNGHSFSILKRSLVFLALGAFTNMCFYETCRHFPDSVFFIILTRTLYHVFVSCALLLFVCYTRDLLNLPNRTYSAVTKCTHVGFFIGVILDVLSPLTHFGFYYEDGLWSDSTYLKPYTFLYIYSLAIMGYLLVFYGNKMIKTIRNSLIISEIICVGIDIIENIYDSNTFATFTFLIPLIAVFTLLHSMPYDTTTGAMNSDAFTQFLKHLKKKNRVADYMILQLEVGELKDLPQELGEVLCSFWNKTFKSAHLFRLHGYIYILAIDRPVDSESFEEKIKTLVEEDFYKYYYKFHISYKSIMLLSADYIETIEDMDATLSFFLKQCPADDFLYPSEKQLADLLKAKAIKKELEDINNKCDLDDERILVYCQPVKNVAWDCFDTAEVLMRLKLPDLGLVFPDQFIPIAESHGYIHTMSKIILHKTCKELRLMLDEGYNIERISINFTIDELRNSNFEKEILGIIKSTDVPFDKVAIELTESQNDSDFHLVAGTIAALKSYGIKFYLDDFGTGYSNLARILHLDFDIIKFDRSLLLFADSENDGFKLLQHFSEIFEELDYKILFEGVENEDHEKICQEAHADYLQGYKYSKPIPFAEARTFLSK